MNIRLGDFYFLYKRAMNDILLFFKHGYGIINTHAKIFHIFQKETDGNRNEI